MAMCRFVVIFYLEILLWIQRTKFGSERIWIVYREYYWCWNCYYETRQY